MVRSLDALALDLGAASGSPAAHGAAGGRFLDRIQEDFARGAARRGMEDLFSGLLLLRALASPERWRRFAREEAIAHPLRKLVHQDPMSRRSFEKPRGYPGDAPLLDYIYRIQCPSAAEGPSGEVYGYAVERPAARGVRERREHLAREIDAVAERVAGPRVLSIACGHLREAALSRAVREGELGELVAVDGDRASLDEVERSFRREKVRVVHASVRRLLARPPEWGRFDLIYSAGLYDYLPRRTAMLLTRWMFDRLAPGGRLLFTNFLPTVPDSGYMESYMGWELIYRDLDGLAELTRELPAERIAEQRVFQDAEESIGYLVLDRA